MDGGVERLIPAVNSSSASVIPPTSLEISAAVDEVEDAPTLVDSSPPSDDGASPPPPTAASSEVDIRAKIIKQVWSLLLYREKDHHAPERSMVEYYFSDENLPSDKFLMRYVKKDKEGFVPISLIASFRKVKRLTKDSSVIVDALKESSQLVLSSDCKKVKRLHPLPSCESNDSKYCTVVVENLPEDRSTENIRRICGQIGSIRSISIHDPQATQDSKRTKAEKLISGKLHALIEYETEEAAEKAVVTLNDETDWRNGLRVQLLRKRMGLGAIRKARKGLDSEKGGLDRVPESVKEVGNSHLNEQHNEAPDKEEGDHVSKEKNGQKGRNRSKGRRNRGNNGMGHGAASVVEPSKPPPGPRMPDGTRGFAMGRGRPLISSNV